MGNPIEATGEVVFLAQYHFTSMGWRTGPSGLEFFTERMPAEPRLSPEALRAWLDADSAPYELRTFA